MMLAYKDIVGYLHYYAARYRTSQFEHDELVNEAWIVVHKLKHIEFASQGIRWAMMTYKARENQCRRYGSSTARVLPLETDTGVNKLVMDMLAKPTNYIPDIDTVDTISWLADNANLSLDSRLILDQRFHMCMSLRDIADTRGCTYQNVMQLLKGILNRLCCAARRLERRDLLVSVG